MAWCSPWFMFVNQFGHPDIGDTDDLGLFQNLALVSPGLWHDQAVFRIAIVQFDQMPSGTGLRHALFFRIDEMVTRFVLEEVIDFELVRCLLNMGSSLKWKGLRMLTPRSSYSFGKDDNRIVVSRVVRSARFRSTAPSAAGFT